MTTATVTQTLPKTRSTVSPVVRTGALAAVAAAAATSAVAGLARLADVPLKVAPKSAAVGEAIPIQGFAMMTLIVSAVGIVLAVAVLRWAKRPARTFVAITGVLTALSFAPSVTAGHATTATKLVLCLTHVVAAAIVVPSITAALRSARS